MRQDSKQSFREQNSLSVPVIYFHITTWFERELAMHFLLGISPKLFICVIGG
jgi:hypothetical protein